MSDPLFTCRATPLARGELPGGEQTAGRFVMDRGDTGFRLFGFLRRGVRHVSITLDGVPLRVQATGGSKRLPDFAFTLRRSAMAAFPSATTVQVRTDQGVPLKVPTGGLGYRLRVPHGDGTLWQQLGPGGTLDKKGSLPMGAAGLGRRRLAYLDLYARARDAFETLLGRSLFLMYGTLLGCWRDGDLIPGDDDFDVGYVSQEGDPERVKQDAFEVVERLVRAGFAVSFNRRGRLFRLSDPVGRVPDPQARVHLDVRPLWFLRGNVWAHNHFTMPSELADWLPAEEARLGTTTVLLPRRTERFLEGHYGTGWRVPDPGFTYFREDVPEAVWAMLDRGLITPPEYRRLRERVDRLRNAGEASGTVASDGWDDLYPLPDGHVAEGGALARRAPDA